MNEQELNSRVLTEKSLRSVKEHDEHHLWEYASTLFRMQNVVLQMEKTEKDPDVVKDLATRAIDLASELGTILAILEDAMPDQGLLRLE